MNEPDEEEKLVDPIDIACQKEMAAREAAIFHARAANKPETDANFEAPYCLTCGDEIPDERLKLGKIRCVACQNTREKLQKLRGT